MYQSTEVKSSNHEVYVGKTQNTWSPCTFSPKRPTIKELKNSYFSVSNQSKLQKNVKFPFLRGNTTNWKEYLYIPKEENLPCIPENRNSEGSESKSSPVLNTRKFVVTPASLDGGK